MEFLVCLLSASHSHLELSFDLLETTVRIPLASSGIRSLSLLKSYRVSFSGYGMLTKQSLRARQVSETHVAQDLTHLKEALACNFP